MTQWVLVVVGAFLTAGTALFVAAEFSLVALNRAAVQRAVDAGDQRAAPVLASLRQLSTQLSAAQVGITLTTLLLGYIVQPSLGALLNGPVRLLGVSAGAADGIAGVLAIVLATGFSMVLGELLPQFLGISASLGVAKVVAMPVRMFGVLTRPLIVLLNGSANLALRALGITPQEELSGARTPQELSSLVRRSAEAGTMEIGTARLISRSLQFGAQSAADVMTPRVRCEAIERTASVADVITLARATGHSRFPVIGEDWDDVDGLVHVKRALAVPHDRREQVPVSALMTSPLMVPETIRLDPLMLQLRAASFQLAIVVDEYGGTSGVVTLEDLVEEIVGEVSDEHDPSTSDGRALPDGSWMVPGMWRPDEVRDRVGAPVPDGPAYETMGGYVMARLGRVPAAADEVAVGRWVVQVEAMDGRRVDRVRIVPTSDSAEVPGERDAVAADGADHAGQPSAAAQEPEPAEGATLERTRRTG